MNSFIKEMVKNALILCAITLVAGVLLGAVYEVTKEPREKQQEITRQNAYKEVMAEADSFEEMELSDAVRAEITAALSKQDITDKNVVLDQCIRALGKDSDTVGYVISVTSKEGYGGDISFTVGIDSNGHVTGVSILSISETAGLGMNAKEESFLSQYKAEGEGLFVVKKADGAEGINIDAISGATITSKAMTKGVNAAKIVYGCIREGGEANE